MYLYLLLNKINIIVNIFKSFQNVSVGKPEKETPEYS